VLHAPGLDLADQPAERLRGVDGIKHQTFGPGCCFEGRVESTVGIPYPEPTYPFQISGTAAMLDPIALIKGLWPFELKLGDTASVMVPGPQTAT
jgi:hypothetical protein